MIIDIKRIMGVGPNVQLRIGSCAMLAAVIAIIIWSSRNGAKGHMVLRTGNQNVLARIAKTKTTDGFPNSILRRSLDHLLSGRIEVFPRYIMSDHNMSADGLTMCADEEVTDWLHIVRLGKEALPTEWVRSILEPSGRPVDVGAFTLMGVLYEFYRSGHHFVCEWRPGCYATSGVLSVWGIPSSCYGVVRPNIRQMAAPQVSTPKTGGVSFSSDKKPRSLRLAI